MKSGGGILSLEDHAEYPLDAIFGSIGASGPDLPISKVRRKIAATARHWEL